MISRLGQPNQIQLLTIRADWSLGINSNISGQLRWTKNGNGKLTSQNVKYNIMKYKC